MSQEHNALNVFMSFLETRETKDKYLTTHILIGNPDRHFCITDSDYKDFISLYDEVYKSGTKLCITEKVKGFSPLLVNVTVKDTNFNRNLCIEKIVFSVDDAIKDRHETTKLGPMVITESRLVYHIFAGIFETVCNTNTNSFYIIFPNIILTSCERLDIIYRVEKVINDKRLVFCKKVNTDTWALHGNALNSEHKLTRVYCKSYKDMAKVIGAESLKAFDLPSTFCIRGGITCKKTGSIEEDDVSYVTTKL